MEDISQTHKLDGSTVINYQGKPFAIVTDSLVWNDLFEILSYGIPENEKEILEEQIKDYSTEVDDLRDTIEELEEDNDKLQDILYEIKTAINSYQVSEGNADTFNPYELLNKIQEISQKI